MVLRVNKRKVILVLQSRPRKKKELEKTIFYTQHYKVTEALLEIRITSDHPRAPLMPAVLSARSADPAAPARASAPPGTTPCRRVRRPR
jgi:hypothetical protein